MEKLLMNAENSHNNNFFVCVCYLDTTFISAIKRYGFAAEPQPLTRPFWQLA